jgi:2-oxoisovalerate dehydrogenase E1 component alpha subunit
MTFQEQDMELSNDVKQDMYWAMLLARRLDERAWIMHRERKIVFHLSAIGHEAAQIGTAFAMRPGHDWLAPYYRDLALMLALGMEPVDFILGLMGKKDDPASGGRQMPGHWSNAPLNVISISTAVAAQTTHAVGIALGIKLRDEDAVVVTTCGEGATSQGEWYEAVNWAAIHKLPVVFLVQNNRFALSVRQEQQMAVSSVCEKACGLGLPGHSIDGANVFTVHETMQQAIEDARDGKGPSLVEAHVHRITPHSSDDDDRSYRTREEVELSREFDPIRILRDTLEAQGVLTADEFTALEEKAAATIDEAIQAAEEAPLPNPEDGAQPVYAEEVDHD